MLNENIKAIRKAKGLSQEELAVKLNVVRQTVSKWEHGLSVPDSEMLLSLSEVLAAGIDAQRDLVLILVVHRGHERAETADARVDQQFFHGRNLLGAHILLIPV